MKIGFIGIGQMGSRMARRLLEAGHTLLVHDSAKGAGQDLLSRGAQWMDTPKAIAESSPLVITMLPGPPEVEEVVYGPKGLMAGWKQGDIYIDMSTSLPTTTRRVARDAGQKGVAVLDAPVSGGIVGAEGGTLSIMVGGDMNVLEKVRNILEKMGKKVFYMGDTGCGNIAKLANNIIAMTCDQINGEAFVLGVKGGIDPQKLWEVVTASSGSNFQLRELWPRGLLRDNFEPGFRLSLALKDISLALALAREYGLPLPLTACVEQRLLEGKATGLGDKTFQSTILRMEEMAGVQVRIRKPQ